MSRVVKEQELRDLAIGATFMAAGGGGSPVNGMQLIDELVTKGRAEVTLIDTKEMKDDECSVMVVEFGSPKAMLEAESFPELVTSFTKLQQIAPESGLKISTIFSGEMGGLNTITGMYTAALKGVPFVDADGQGRAVPELNTCLFHINDIPHSPFVLAGYTGDAVVAYLNDRMDFRAAENIARNMTMAYGQRAGFAGILVNREKMEKLVPKSVTTAINVGKAFREAEDFAGLSEALGEIVDARELFRGKIAKIEIKSVGGFDFGVTSLEGVGTYAGQSRTIGYKNENMLMRDESGKVLVTVPDLIITVDLDELQPQTNADTKEGQNVAVFGVRAAEAWFRTPLGFTVWKEILEKLDYHGEYMPVK